jgi:hypothetical protein
MIRITTEISNIDPDSIRAGEANAKARAKLYIQELEKWLREDPQLDYLLLPALQGIRRHVRRSLRSDREAVLIAIFRRQAWTIPEIAGDTRLPKAHVLALLTEMVETGQVSMRRRYVADGDTTQGAAGRAKHAQPLFVPPGTPAGSDYEIPKGEWQSALAELTRRWTEPSKK